MATNQKVRGSNPLQRAKEQVRIFFRACSFFVFFCKGFESPLRKQSGGLFLGRRVDDTRFFRIRTFRGGNYFSALPPCSAPKNKFGYSSGLVLFLHFCCKGFESPFRKQFKNNIMGCSVCCVLEKMKMSKGRRETLRPFLFVLFVYS